MKSECVPFARLLAEDAFRSGLNCAESVVLALSEVMEVESDILPKIATGFGKGMDDSIGPCGAITGAIIWIGLAFGRSSPVDPDHVAYEATRQFIRQFDHEFGATSCKDLLGCDLGSLEGKAVYRLKKMSKKCE